jgi:hypothetical protein
MRAPAASSAAPDQAMSLRRSTFRPAEQRFRLEFRNAAAKPACVPRYQRTCAAGRWGAVGNPQFPTRFDRRSGDFTPITPVGDGALLRFAQSYRIAAE